MKYINQFFLCFIFVIYILLQLSPYVWCENADTSFGRNVNVGVSAGVFTDSELKDIVMATNYWFDMMDRERYQAKAIILYSLDSIVDVIKNNNLDLVSLGSIEYLAIKNKVDLEPFLVGAYHDGKSGEKYILLVRKDRGVGDLKDLRGKKIMLVAGRHRTISQFWIDTLLFKEGLPESKDFFGFIEETQKISEAVLPVFFNQADAAIATTRTFDTMVELNPQLGNELTVIASSKELLTGFVCFTNTLNKKDKDYMRQNLTNLHNRPEAKQTLMLYHIDKFIPFDVSYLDNIIALVKEHDELKKK